MPEQPDSCTRPVRGPILPPAEASTVSDTRRINEEKNVMIARVGKQAPDFEAMAFHEGKFKTVKLSDHAGHWILLCFYPGDFTFV